MFCVRWPIPLVLAALATSAAADNREVPYWATLRASEVNMRVGPSRDFPIAWVYKRAGLPVKVVRLNQGWRLIEDPDGTRGWVLLQMLKAERGAIVRGKGKAELRSDPDAEAKTLWRAEPGVVGALGKCENGWCRFSVGGRSGWIRGDRVWGAGEP
jgi:SH3-like domain-containing protein